MKPNKHFVAAACIVIAAACLIALTWIGTMRGIEAERRDHTARVTATLANQALTFSEQIDRQILAIDQTLRILAAAWQADPRHFDLETRRAEAVVLNGLSRDMVLTDENGVVRQSSVSEAIDQSASGLDCFRVLADPSNPGDKLYIGAATIDGLMRQWHINVARALRYPDGSFAGVIDADYRIAAITDVFGQTDLGAGSMMALVGLDDGKLRGAVGLPSIDPDSSIGDTAMFAAIRDARSGVWTGPSASDAVERIHAFRRLPGQNLAVVVAMSEAEAMRPVNLWRGQAMAFAGCITVLLAALAVLLIHLTRLGRRQAAVAAEDRAILAACNAQLEVAREAAATKTEQLDATLAGMSDGISIIDAHLCLVEWNARFAEVAGVAPDSLRVGMPIEEVLRAQIKSGQFGSGGDPDAEVERRLARLRIAPVGVIQRQLPDGRTVELRRNRLSDGALVTLYADVTQRKPGTGEAGAEARFAAVAGDETALPAGALPFPPEPEPTQREAVETYSPGPVLLAPEEPGVADLRRRTLPRTRILLIEHVAAHRVATAALLRREGHCVDTVTGGPSAIDAARMAPYDLVLMNLFMPGISGQEAARLIRALPEPACSTPIIAVTADAGPHDEEVLRAAGMDGILAKPFSQRELVDVLRKYVWSVRSTIDEPESPEEAGDMLEFKRAIPVLSADRISELRTNLSPGTFNELIEECLLDMDHRLPALRRAVVSGAPAAITAQAHAMVGMAAGYGMAAMEARLRTIMAAARDGGLGALDSTIIARLESDFAEAARTLREIVRGEVV